jgi:hypothetical protein
VRQANIPDQFLVNGLVNTFLLLGSRFLIMEQLDYNSGRAVFSMWPMLRGYNQDEVCILELIGSSVEESVGEDLSCRQRNSHCWSHYQETSSTQ